MLDSSQPGRHPPKIALYRKEPYGANVGKLVWLRDYQVQELDSPTMGFELIRAEHGPGVYVMRLYGYRPGSTRYTVLCAPEIIIGDLAEHRQDRAPLPAPANGDLTALSTVLQRMVDAQQAFQAQVIQTLQARPDPMASMRDMLTMMGAMREAMGLNATPQKSSVGEIIEAIKELKGASELLGDKPEPPESELQQMLALARPVVSMVAQSTQAQPQPVVPQMAPRVDLPATFHPPLPANPTLPAPAPAQPTPTAESPMSTPTPDQTADQAADQEAASQLQAMLAEFILRADGGADPVDTAEWLYEVLPDELLDGLQSPMWWSALSTHVPQLAPHKVWAGVVRAELLSIIAEESGEGTDPAEAPTVPTPPATPAAPQS